MQPSSCCSTGNPGRAYFSGVLTSPRPKAATLLDKLCTSRQGDAELVLPGKTPSKSLCRVDVSCIFSPCVL